MEELYTAVTITLIGQQRFVIHTNDYANTKDVFHRLILIEACNFSDDEIVVIDLLEYNTKDDLLKKMIYEEYPGHFSFKSIIIWRNLENLSINDEQKRVLSLINEIDQYDTVQSRIDQSKSSTINIGEYSISKPAIFTIIPIVEVAHDRAKFHRNIKDKFWFSQFYYFESLKVSENNNFNTKCPNDKFIDYIADIRQNTLPKIYISPDMQRYIYSLIVFTRCHRLCSLAPMETRLPTRTIDSITLLAKCLVSFNFHEKKVRLFVTPEYGKIAYKKVANWMVDWEQNKLFKREADSRQSTPSFDQEEEDDDDDYLELEYRKRYEISLLTGDWYGCEWNYAKDYINSCHSREDYSSSVGFTNRIVEDVLQSVMPPL